jgi:hypothetical protein
MLAVIVGLHLPSLESGSVFDAPTEGASLHGSFLSVQLLRRFQKSRVANGPFDCLRHRLLGVLRTRLC